MRGKASLPVRPAFASPALTADGTAVFFEAQQPAPPLAVPFGEVNVEGSQPHVGSGAGAPRRVPGGSGGATVLELRVSGDGRRIAFEVSAGNRTFAKRYGNVAIAVADLVTRRVRALPAEAYAPSLSGDGRSVAFAVAGGRVVVRIWPRRHRGAWASAASRLGPGGLTVMVRDLAAGATVRASPRAPLARFGSGAGALEQEGRAVCAMAPPVW